eukprot:712822-Ditylum_brightwellii.AAC.1
MEIIDSSTDYMATNPPDNIELGNLAGDKGSQGGHRSTSPTVEPVDPTPLVGERKDDPGIDVPPITMSTPTESLLGADRRTAP